MSLISKLPEILEEARKKYEKESCCDGFFSVAEIVEFRYGNEKEHNVETLELALNQKQPVNTEAAIPFSHRPQLKSPNQAAYGDNAAFMRFLLNQGYGGKLNLIYIDPPFYSNADYAVSTSISSEGLGSGTRLKHRAYGDKWQDGMEQYLGMLAYRLFLMKELLSEEGGIWVHLDWHVVHYVKLLMDEIFGPENFINEVIWNYKSGGTSKRHFARKHDTLLYYGKTKKYYFKPVKEKSYNRGLKPYRFKGVEEFQDEMGWYTLVNKKDVWQIDMVGRTAKERTGYATQKPELLLEQILESCTREGDLCADFFCGSGTLAAVSAKMGRNFIVCDAGKAAVNRTYRRLYENKISFQLWGNLKEGFQGTVQAALVLPTAEHVQAREQNQDKLGLESGRAILRLQNYIPPPADQYGLPAKDRKQLQELLNRNPMNVLSYGTIGVKDRAGQYYPACFFNCNGSDTVLLEDWNQGKLWENQELWAVITDVFGNYMETKVSPISGSEMTAV